MEECEDWHFQALSVISLAIISDTSLRTKQLTSFRFCHLKTEF